MARPPDTINFTVFKGVFKHGLVAGTIGGVVYCIVLTALRVADVGLSYAGVERVISSGLSMSICGAPFGLFLGTIFGVIDGAVLCILMEIERFKPPFTHQHVKVLSRYSAIIMAISVIVCLSPFDVPRSQIVSTNVAVLALIAAIGAWWGARDTLTNFSIQQQPDFPTPDALH